MSAFDWNGLLRAGLTQLGLKPAEFWALTPAELALMLGHPASDQAMSRSALDALLQQYPDEGPGASSFRQKDTPDG
jgi:uncharacterized phage protein (TIGR02216 family)